MPLNDGIGSARVEVENVAIVVENLNTLNTFEIFDTTLDDEKGFGMLAEAHKDIGVRVEIGWVERIDIEGLHAKFFGLNEVSTFFGKKISIVVKSNWVVGRGGQNLVVVLPRFTRTAERMETLCLGMHYERK